MASIEPFIHRKVVVLRQDASARQAARAMCEQSIGCVVVSDHQGHITGIVTDRDLACALVSDAGDPETPLSRIMTSPVATASEHAELEQVIGLMESHGVRRIPVLSHKREPVQRCEGLISLDDLIASRSIDEYQLIRIVRSQVRRRIRMFRNLIDAEPRVVGQGSASDFYHELIARAGLREFDWDDDVSRRMIQLVFEALVERLHHTGAMLLITELPLSLQEELLELPPGPDPTVTAQRILLELQARFGIASDSACAALRGICHALDEILDYERLGHVKAQLPPDLRALFHERGEAA